jgi:long-chain fatty acid transport protein
LTLTVAALAAGISPARAQTDGYLLPCSAASQLGRGCTLLAGSRDPATMLLNPAGLASVGGAALSLSGAAFLPTMAYSNAVNSDVAGEDNVYPIPAVYFAARPRGDWAFGIGAQTLGGMGADYRLTHPLLGANQRYHSKFGLMRGGVVVAWRASPKLAIGGSIGLLYGQLEFATPYSVNPQVFAGLAGLAQDPDYAPMLQNFTEATAYAELTGLSGIALSGGLSVEYRPSDRVSLALAWTAPSTVTVGGGQAVMDLNTQFGQLYQGMVAAKGGDTATVNGQLGGFGIDLAAGMTTTFGVEGDMGVPQTVTLALGLRPDPRWSLGVDIAWIGWKNAFDGMPIRLTDGSNGNINILMNADPADGGFATTWPMEWKDSWTVRAGAEYAALPRLALRAGLVHGTNPVSSQGLFTIFPAIVQTAATAGVGYQLGRTTLHLTYAHTFENDQTAATPHIVATEYAGSTSTLAEKMIALGASWRF